MSKRPIESIMEDTEVMDEIHALMESRKKLSRVDEIPNGKKAVLEFLNPPFANAESRIDVDLIVREAIVRSFGRPSLLIQDGAFEEPEMQTWRQRLDPVRENVENVIPSVGRVELLRHPDFDWVGTAWVVAERVLVTNRHVAETFAERRGQTFVISRNRMGEQIGARIDFLEEHRRPDELEIEVDQVLFIAPQGRTNPDIAIIKVKSHANLPDPIPLASDDPKERDMVGVIGYPARDSRNGNAEMMRIFHDIFDVKRLAPGFVVETDMGDTFTHDGTTLGGNSGSPVVDLHSGEVVGLHFGGRFLTANFAVKVNIVKQTLAQFAAIVPGMDEFEEEEALRPEDYADREGYKEDFLGRGNRFVPLPGLSSDLRADAVEVNGRLRGINAFTLDYTHFSVVLSESRKLAIFTAVNIDGNSEVSIRRRNTKWKIDLRIPRNSQTGNELYRRNPLDRGHLVRRLDPVWGSRDEARQAEDDTFHYSNAAPQHARLNQRVWLSLENFLLHNTNNRDLKISVFTGPIFSSSDITYRGVKIPEEFWKVVAMVNPRGKLHATAYLLSQKRFLDDLEFVFGPFRSFQVSIAQIERETGLDFARLKDVDPIGDMERVEGEAGLEIDYLEDIVM